MEHISVITACIYVYTHYCKIKASYTHIIKMMGAFTAMLYDTFPASLGGTCHLWIDN
jgi:hypothetical protein